MGGVPGLEQNYLYGQYAQGGSVPFGGLTVQPRVTPTPSVEPTTGISIPGQVGFVSDENGNKISLGQDGVGLAHKDPKEFNFMAVA